MKKLNVIVIREKDEDLKPLLSSLEEYDNILDFSFVENDYSKNADLIKKEIEKGDSEYIMFINNSEKYNYKTIIKSFLSSSDADVFFINHYAKATRVIEDKIIDENNISEYSNFINLSIFNYIFKRKVLKKYSLKNDFNIECNIDFVSSIVDKVKSVYVINNLENKVLTINIDCFKHSKEWYFNCIKNYMSLVKNNKSKFTIFGVLRLLSNKYSVNMNSDDTHVFDDKLLSKYEKETKSLLDLIDDAVIRDYFDHNLHFPLFYTLMKIKHSDKKVDLSYGNCNIEVIDYVNDKLIMDIKLPMLVRNNNQEEVYFLLNKDKIIPKENNVYSVTKFFGKVYHESRTFTCEIPVSKLKKNNKISVNIDGYMFPLLFTKPMSKVSEKLKHSYYNFSKYTLKCDNQYMYINETNKLTRFNNEIKFLFNILFNRTIKSKKFLTLKSFFLRLLYWITKPFYRKEVWICYDKLYKGGDNGEYFFHYAYDNDKTRKVYYVINKTANDYKRLKKQGGILKYRSLRHYLNVLNAKTIFSTHANPYRYNGFAPTIDPFFRDLLTFDTFCIQHGLSVNQIAKFQNRVYANTKLYFCASYFEIDNLKDPSYDYNDSQLLLTGIPRFDGLKNNNKKQILITPTWRHDVAANTDKLNEARGYNSQFKNTMYYKMYFSLITNKKLVDCAKKHNYKIIYLLHPAVAGQIDDFPTDIYTKVIPSTGNMSYETILRESSLMVTDYSGVQFDFAYMRKPIVYYHPDELPPHYEEGGLVYEKEGFGPVIKTEDALVDCICKYIENDCKNDKKYIERTKKFFKYDDFDTCKRIYEETLKYYNKQ